MVKPVDDRTEHAGRLGELFSLLREAQSNSTAAATGRNAASETTCVVLHGGFAARQQPRIFHRNSYLLQKHICSQNLQAITGQCC